MEPLSNHDSLSPSHPASDPTTVPASAPVNTDLDDTSAAAPDSPTMAQSKNQKKQNDEVVKHRACDECRSRKLACSKEPNGCSRCRKEGLKCHYSPQKPMGRPRKRRHTDEYEERTARQQDGPLAPQPTVSLDTNFSFLDTDVSNLDYLDLLSPLDGAPPSTLPPELASLTAAHHQPQFPPDLQFGQFNGLDGGDVLGGIHFDECDSADEEMTKTLNQSISEYLTHQVPEQVPESVPGLSPNSGNTPESELAPSPRSFANISCPCLSQMYLALDALGNLPEDISAAMCTARTAARVAHDVVHCQYCSLPLVHDPTLAPSMQAFQNMMMLGALIPATANCYARILEMIDIVAAEARKDGRMLTFRFQDYGGLWGELYRQENACGVILAYNNKEYNPDGWRQTIRALLRIDIYGFNVPRPAGTSLLDEVHHLGLRDVINELEERSRIRHEKVDQMIESGHPMSTHNHFISPPDNSKENRNCLRIIEFARNALDKLVIA